MLVLTRRAPKQPDEVRWDPVRGIERNARMDGLDAVVQLAGEPLANRPWTASRRRLLWSSRVDATGVLLASLAGLARPPGTFVGVSSIGRFGDCGDRVIDDDDPPGSGFLADMSTAWEAASERGGELGARVAILRMTVALSPVAGAFPRMVAPFRYVGGWLGDGRQYTSWIGIDDAVAALTFLMDEPSCNGAYNGTVPDAIPNFEWCSALGRALSVPVRTGAPRWALRGALGELADALFLASLRARPRRLLEAGFAFQDVDAETTFRKLLGEVP